MTPFFAALEFLTVIRVRRGSVTGMGDVARALGWFPVVGLVLGGALLAIDRLASRALPAPSVDVFLVVALAGLTGALHLDGLADAADGLFGGHTSSERLEIMRDPHAGTYAIVAIASILALKWAGLAAVLPRVRYETLLLAPALARASMAATVVAFPYARAAGMGAEMKGHALPIAAPTAIVIALAASVALLGAGGVYIAVFAAGSGLACGAVATRLAGGMTGDLYGATIEVVEALTLVFAAAFAQRGWIDAFAFGR